MELRQKTHNPSLSETVMRGVRVGKAVSRGDTDGDPAIPADREGESDAKQLLGRGGAVFPL